MGISTSAHELCHSTILYYYLRDCNILLGYDIHCIFRSLLFISVPECHGKLDAVFLLDVSNSITDTSLDSVRSLVEYMVNSFNESIPGSLRMSVVWYAEIIYPTDRSLTGNLEMALSNMNSFDRYSDVRALLRLLQTVYCHSKPLMARDQANNGSPG